MFHSRKGASLYCVFYVARDFAIRDASDQQVNRQEDASYDCGNKNFEIYVTYLITQEICDLTGATEELNPRKCEDRSVMGLNADIESSTTLFKICNAFRNRTDSRSITNNLIDNVRTTSLSGYNFMEPHTSRGQSVLLAESVLLEARFRPVSRPFQAVCGLYVLVSILTNFALKALNHALD